jgi:hypothetical protein
MSDYKNYVNPYNYLDRTRWKKDNGKSNLCLCSGVAGRTKLHANRANILNSYLDGCDEYQDFATIQKRMGGPFWKNTNFDLY